MSPSLAGTSDGFCMSGWITNNGSGYKLYSSKSLDDGVSWSAPAKFPSDSWAANPGGDFSPHVSASITSGSFVAVMIWSSEKFPGAGGDSDIVFSRSTNYGTTWSGPQLLSGSFSSDGFCVDGGPKTATDGLGSWMAVWYSERLLSGVTGGKSILCAISKDNAITWSEPRLVNGTAGTSAGQVNTFPSVVYSNGAWLASWQVENGQENQPLYIVRSTNDGATWSTGLRPDGIPGSVTTGVFSALDSNEYGMVVLAYHRLVPSFFGQSYVDFVKSFDGGVTWSYGSWQFPSDTRPFLVSRGADWYLGRSYLSTPSVAMSNDSLMSWSYKGLQAGTTPAICFNSQNAPIAVWLEPISSNAGGTTSSLFVARQVPAIADATWLRVD